MNTKERIRKCIDAALKDWENGLGSPRDFQHAASALDCLANAYDENKADGRGPAIGPISVSLASVLERIEKLEKAHQEEVFFTARKRGLIWERIQRMRGAPCD